MSPSMNSSCSLKWIGLVILIFALGALVFIDWGSASFPVPQVNGYDDFIHASALVRGYCPDPYSRRQTVEKFVSQNAEVYAFVEAGLGKSCRVTVQVSKDWANAHQDQVARLKRVTYCLIAKGRLSLMEGRTDEAFEAYMKAYRFASQISAGGLALDFMNGISCKALVLEWFKALIPNLTSEERNEALRVMDSIESGAEDARVVLRRHSRWYNATFGLKGRIERLRKSVEDIVRTRSLSPLSGGYLLSRQELYKKKYVDPIRDQLRKSVD